MITKPTGTNDDVGSSFCCQRRRVRVKHSCKISAGSFFQYVHSTTQQIKKVAMVEGPSMPHLARPIDTQTYSLSSYPGKDYRRGKPPYYGFQGMILRSSYNNKARISTLILGLRQGLQPKHHTTHCHSRPISLAQPLILLNLGHTSSSNESPGHSIVSNNGCVFLR